MLTRQNLQQHCHKTCNKMAAVVMRKNWGRAAAVASQNCRGLLRTLENPKVHEEQRDVNDNAAHQLQLCNHGLRVF